jgi:hypothetical protein
MTIVNANLKARLRARSVAYAGFAAALSYCNAKWWRRVRPLVGGILVPTRRPNAYPGLAAFRCRGGEQWREETHRKRRR